MTKQGRAAHDFKMLTYFMNFQNSEKDAQIKSLKEELAEKKEKEKTPPPFAGSSPTHPTWNDKKPYDFQSKQILIFCILNIGSVL